MLFNYLHTLTNWSFIVYLCIPYVWFLIIMASFLGLRQNVIHILFASAQSDSMKTMIIGKVKAIWRLLQCTYYNYNILLLLHTNDFESECSILYIHNKIY